MTKDNEIEVSQTWNKFVNTATNAGYREGMFDGKEQVFQKGFDEGYIEGFKLGIALGKYRGVISGDSLPDDENLAHTRRGLCEICKNNNLLESSIEDVKHMQRQISNNILSNLHKKYANISHIKLNDKVE